MRYTLQSSPLLYFIGCLFYITVMIFVLLFNISNCEIFEEMEAVKSLLKDKNGQISRVYLVLFRVAALVLSSIPALVTDDPAIVLNVGGAVVIPVISFYLPIICNFLIAKATNQPRSIFWIVHDILFFIVSVGIQVMAVRYALFV